MSSTPTPPTHLIIVCCHAIWLGGPSLGASEDEWLIAPFQRGETPTFVEHAKEGVRRLAEHGEDAVLVFSGGPTKNQTALSEAQSYFNLAHKNNYWSLLPPPSSSSSSSSPSSSHSSTRIAIEHRALDSYHNILFSLTLFHHLHARWPLHVTIVSHAFKQPRLVDNHCLSALRLPRSRLTFRGIDPPAMAAAAAAAAQSSGEGRAEEALVGVVQAGDEWAEDPHGRGQRLRGKREGRNPWGMWQGVFVEEVEEGRRGGLVTMGGEGADETVDESKEMPWV